MLVPFRKMHGAGNDFVVLDARAAPLPLTAERIRGLADRRTGIGCDQLIVLEPPEHPQADVFMRIFNPDGSAAGACGNATRCVAEFLGEEGSIVQTISGLLQAEILGGGTVRVDMGAPALGWREIPLSRPADTLHLDLPGDPAAASMGNPHVTFFVETLDRPEISSRAAALEADPWFPDRANIGFAQVLAPDRIRLRVWERGAGFTRACGSGACAALVNAHRRGFSAREARVEMEGGVLEIAWREADSHVLMTGPTCLAFQGSVDLSTYPA